MSRTQKAVDIFKSGFACSQAVLVAFGKETGMDEKTALKVSCAFGAGMGRSGQTCGAVTGAYLVISMVYGRIQLEDAEARAKTYALVQEFDRQFRQRHGSVNCTQLLGCDLGVPEGYEKASSEGLFKTQCPEFVRTAAAILETIL